MSIVGFHDDGSACYDNRCGLRHNLPAEGERRIVPPRYIPRTEEEWARGVERKLAELKLWQLERDAERAAALADSKEPQSGTGAESTPLQDPVIVTMSEQTKRMNLRHEFSAWRNFCVENDIQMSDEDVTDKLVDLYFEYKAKGY